MPTYTGTDGNDETAGTHLDDTINGLGGNDILSGGDGNDIIHGDDGNDTLDGNAGQDQLYGDAGDDLLIASSPTIGETYNGGTGTDTLRYMWSAATPVTTANGLTYQGGLPSALVSIERLEFGSLAGSTLSLSVSNNLIGGGLSSTAELVGGAGNDSLLIFATTGGTYTIANFTYSNWTNADEAFEAGDTVILVGSGTNNYTLNAATGHLGVQVLLGGFGNDTLNGTDGLEVLNGGGGVNTLNAGGGDDVLIAANTTNASGITTFFDFAGSVFNGGDGFDWLSIGGYVNFRGTAHSIEGINFQPAFTAAPGTGSSQDEAVMEIRTDVVVEDSFAEDLHLRGTGLLSIELIAGDDFDGSLWVHEAGSNVQIEVFGTDGDEDFIGTSGSDRFSGGFGVSTMTGNGGADLFEAGDGQVTVTDFTIGQDRVDLEDMNITSFEQLLPFLSQVGSNVVFSRMYGGVAQTMTLLNVSLANLSAADFVFQTGDDNDIRTGTEQADDLIGGNGNDTIDGLGGNDYLYGGGGDDVINGGGGDDQVYGAAGADLLSGNGGNDVVHGGDGDDAVRGNGGNDQLFGDAGNDNLRGGAGIDSFDGGTNDFVFNNNSGYGDRISFYETNATQGVVADLRTGIISNDGFGNQETMTGIESLGSDTAFADTFYGNDVQNALYGSRGDSLYGFGADDLFLTSSAAAVVDGGDGVDTLTLSTIGGWLMPDTNGDGIAESAAAATAGWVVNLTSGAVTDGYGYTGTVTGIENVDGSALNDRIIGSAGANIIHGNDGSDTLRGGEGNDQLFGGDGNDVLSQGLAGDEYTGTYGDDLYDGGAGADEVSLFTATGPGVTVDLNVTTAQNTGGAGTDTFIGIEHLIATYGNDHLVGNAAANWFWTFSGTDTLFGNGGDDYFTVGSGDKTADGGEGTDTIEIAEFAYVPVYGSAGITVSLALQGTAQNTGAGIWNITGFENLGGFTGDDELTGDNNANVLAGQIGNDTLVGGAGNDTLAGDGTWIIQNGVQVFVENNTGDGPGGNDVLEGGLGNDRLHGGGGSDTAVYAGAAGSVTVSLVTGTATGADGNDTLIDIENVTGSAFADSIIGSAGANILTGGGGNDVLRAGEGDDFLYGGDGNDFLSQTLGEATAATSTYGNDTYDGGAGIDRVSLFTTFGPGVTVDLNITTAQNTGAAGLDTFIGIEHITATFGDDHLTGTSDANFFWTFGGNDTLIGNGGDDFFVIGRQDKVIDGGSGVDTIAIEDDAFEPYYTAEGITVSLLAQGTQQAVGTGTWTLSNIENLGGWYGSDDLTGDGNANILAGDQGNDILRGGGGNDVLAGDGTFTFDFTTNTQVFLENPDWVGGNDLLEGGDGNDTLYGGGGDDDLDGGEGADQLFGGAGDDFYYVDDAGDVVVETAGNGSADRVYSSIAYTLGTAVENLTLIGTAVFGTGNELANKIVGHSDFNVLAGGAGADILTGGGGVDTFKDSAANLNGDTITDFGADDTIIIADANLASFTFSQNGNTVTFGGTTLTLQGFTGTLVASAAAGGGVKLTVQDEPGIRDARNDFNGDGRSDIYWRHTDGTIGDWLANADATFTSNGASINNIPAYWQVVGLADFNGDGRDDVLWRGNGGEVGNWLANADGSHTYNSAAGVTVIPTSWQVDGTGDFNGDGKDDILWRNTDGTAGVWLGQANGGFVANNAGVFNVSTDWHIVATGDFNGDGKDDILWRHDSGTFADWLANDSGGFTPNGPSLVAISNDWHIIGTGDFNNDGRDDILWRHDSGTVANWTANGDGTFAPNFASLVTITNDWNVASIGDYNGDGRDDILWRHDSGTVADWVANTDNSGTFTTNAASFAGIPVDWQVQDPAILLL